jgi:hypothetical protein
MRARLIVLGGAFLSITTGLLIQACGATEKGAPADAGPDALEASADGSADAAKCDLSASLTAKIPDAAIADGASTSGICLGCGHAKCANFVQQCSANCDCQGLAAKGLECYLRDPTNAEACIFAFGAQNVDRKVQAIGLGLGSCINSNCKVECATAAFEDAGDDGGQ